MMSEALRPNESIETVEFSEAELRLLKDAIRSYINTLRASRTNNRQWPDDMEQDDRDLEELNDKVNALKELDEKLNK